LTGNTEECVRNGGPDQHRREFTDTPRIFLGLDKMHFYTWHLINAKQPVCVEVGLLNIAVLNRNLVSNR
jgi:hypothetical protein